MRLVIIGFLVFLVGCSSQQTVNFDDFGAKAGSGQDASEAAAALVQHLSNLEDRKPVVVKLSPGRYDFFPDKAQKREYYISNHDQDNPKNVGFAFENLSNITIDGQGAELVFHGRMLPVSLVGCTNVTLKNLSIDFEMPHLRQLEVTEVDSVQGYFVADLYPEYNYIIKEGRLLFTGLGYEMAPQVSMAFTSEGRLTYQRRDLVFNPQKVEALSPNRIKVFNWQAKETTPGERFVLRTYYRPAPGIFVAFSKNTELLNVSVHYAEGMGLLAQMSEDILLDGFQVALKPGSRRVFTTQADATHFSACKGRIISRNGLYEGMADDAINVHGTYLKITHKVDSFTVIGQYMHHQTYGFDWGMAGDSVQFIQTTRMEPMGQINTIRSVEAVESPEPTGVKAFRIVLSNPLEAGFEANQSVALENLTWTPEVVFSNNTIRNNRARGVLFSTPRRVLCENNLFDHTHGTAILLCGDANGWYETGACREVVIRGNRFVNALTAYYQFTNAVISIYPEIPDLKGQKSCFHSGIVIEDNIFETFDRPLLYAKSVDGLTFKNNRVVTNSDFKPFHWNNHRFFFEKVNNITVSDNEFDTPLDIVRDVRIEHSPIGGVLFK